MIYVQLLYKVSVRIITMEETIEKLEHILSKKLRVD